MPHRTGVLSVLLFWCLRLGTEVESESVPSASLAAECGPSLLLLPSSPDPNTDVLFNMQTRKVEEAVHMAEISERMLVEPYYIFGARNWSWFEDANHNQLVSNDEIHRGMLGTIEEPLHSFFDLPPIEQLLQQPIPSPLSFADACGHWIDLLIRFYGHSGISTCDDSATEVSAWGVIWAARRVVCVHAMQFKTVDDLIDMTRDSLRVAMEFLPPKFVELRKEGWRSSAPRWRVRAALQWAAPLVKEAENFISSQFGLTALDDTDSAQEDAAEAGGDFGDFVAVHWRRGDRGYQEEMGIHGHVDVALTAPIRLVHFVQQVMSDVEGGVAGIFLATNCGNAMHLEYVQENLGAVRRPSSGDWRRAAHEAVIEQIIMSRARVVIVPPGVGNPPNVEDTSNFSLFVLEQRRLNAMRARERRQERSVLRDAATRQHSGSSTETSALAGLESATPADTHADAHYLMCCGASPVLSIWRPRAGDKLSVSGVGDGGWLWLEVWGAFLPSDTKIRVELVLERAACSDPVIIGLGESGPGRVGILGLGHGVRRDSAEVSGAAEQEAAEAVVSLAAVLVSHFGEGEEREVLDRVSLHLPPNPSSLHPVTAQACGRHEAGKHVCESVECGVMVQVDATTLASALAVDLESIRGAILKRDGASNTVALSLVHGMSLVWEQAAGLQGPAGGEECAMMCLHQLRCAASVHLDQDARPCWLVLRDSSQRLEHGVWDRVDAEATRKEGEQGAQRTQTTVAAVKVGSGVSLGARRWRQKRCLPLDYICMYAG